MAYGTIINERSTLSYTSTTNSPSYPEFSDATTQTSKFLSRSGTNAVYSGTTDDFYFVSVVRYRTGIVSTLQLFRTRRLTVGSYTTGGKPIYSREPRKFLPSGKLPPRRIIGYSKIRVRYIYKYVRIPYVKNKYGKIPYFIHKRIKKPAVPGKPDLTPHAMTMTSLEVKNPSSACAVSLTRTTPPHLVNDTLIVGILAGTHNGAREDFGYNTGPSQCAYMNSSQISIRSTALSDQCINRLYDKISGEAVNLGELAGERKETIHMLYDIFSTAVHLAVNAKRELSRLAVGSTEYKFIANKYLQYIYGLAPLVSDAQNSLEELSKETRTWRKYATVATDSWDENQTFTHGYSTVNIKEHYDLLVKNHIVLTGTDNFPRFLISHGLTNLPSLAWELMPWSFVIDWFYPIGNFLQSENAFSGVNVHSWHESILVKKTTTITVLHYSPPGALWTSGGTEVQITTGTKTTFSRQLRDTVPPYRLPVFKNPFSIRHLVTSLMLLIQKL